MAVLGGWAFSYERGYPVLLGYSRKPFAGRCVATGPPNVDRPCRKTAVSKRQRSKVTYPLRGPGTSPLSPTSEGHIEIVKTHPEIGKTRFKFNGLSYESQAISLLAKGRGLSAVSLDIRGGMHSRRTLDFSALPK